MSSQKTYMHDLWTWTNGGLLEGMGYTELRGKKWEKWDNCNNIINKIYILKSYKKKSVSYLQGSSHKSISWLLKETLQTRRDWQEIFKVMRSRDLQPRLFYPAKIPFRIERKIKIFPDKKKLKEFVITKLLLYELLKGLIWEKY